MKNIILMVTLFMAMFTSIISAKNVTDDEPAEIDNSIVIDRITNDDIQIIIPSPVFSFTDVEIKIKFIHPQHTKLLLNENKVEFIINGENKVLNFENGEASFKHRFNESNSLSIYAEDFSYNHQVTVYPLWAILIPVILIILFILKRIIKK